MRTPLFRCVPIRVPVLMALAVAPARPLQAQTAPLAETIEIDAQAAAHPFPHFWEKMFGSRRAILSLRESYRNDLRETRRITGFEYVRFHAIFHDETGLYDEDKDGKPVYNFSYVDQIYDGLLENHVRPFIELSFIPKKLASDPGAPHPFWYKQNVSPPKDGDRGDNSSKPLRGTWSSGMGSRKSRNGISRCGTSPTLAFGRATPKSKPITSSMTALLAQSSA